MVWQFIDHFVAFVILGFATVQPTLADLAPEFLPVGSPYISIVYYATTAISLLAAGLCPCIPQPPINPLFVLLSFGSVVYTSRVFGTQFFFGVGTWLTLLFRACTKWCLFSRTPHTWSQFPCRRRYHPLHCYWTSLCCLSSILPW